MESFDHVVSLGAWCQTTEQLRRKFRTTLSPFDHCATSLKTVVDVLEGRVIPGADVEPIDRGGSAQGVTAEMIYHHEFPRDAEGRMRIDDETRAALRDSMRRRLEVMDQACSTGRTLFVRHGGAMSHLTLNCYIDEPRPVTAGDLAGLLSALNARYPGADHRLAFVYYASRQAVDTAGLDPRIALYALPDPTPEVLAGIWGWRGQDEDWDTVLNAYDQRAPLPASADASAAEAVAV